MNWNSISDTYLRYAHGIVSEYLCSSLRSSLLSSLNLPEVKPADPSSKRKLLTAQSPNIEDAEAKRIKLDGDEFREKSVGVCSVKRTQLVC